MVVLTVKTNVMVILMTGYDISTAARAVRFDVKSSVAQRHVIRAKSICQSGMYALFEISERIGAFAKLW